jgi:hypothetical protein
MADRSHNARRGAPRRAPALLAAPLAALAYCALAGCEPQERPTVIDRPHALDDPVPRRMHIIKVYDQVYDATDAPRDINVSHEIKVRVLDGPGEGKLWLLPYDEWNVGRPPPKAGLDVVAAPSDWVRRDPNSTGVPFGGFPH